MVVEEDEEDEDDFGSEEEEGSFDEDAEDIDEEVKQLWNYYRLRCCQLATKRLCELLCC